MKKTLLSFLFISVFGIGTTILLTSSSNGRAFAANSGNTRAPGENTNCRTCHGTGFNTTVSIAIKDASGAPVTSYIPGSIYTVDFTVNSSGGARWGYQLTSLTSANLPVTNFSNPSANTRLVTLGNGRQYAEHAGKSSTNTFSTSWTAPTSGTGTITFYGSGAAVNNNGGTSGDGGNFTNLALTENTSVGITEVSTKESVSIYPNPTSDFISIDAKSANYKNATVSLVNKKGQIIFQQNMNLQENTVNQIETDSFRNGIYLIRVEGEQESFVTKVILK